MASHEPWKLSLGTALAHKVLRDFQVFNQQSRPKSSLVSLGQVIAADGVQSGDPDASTYTSIICS